MNLFSVSRMALAQVMAYALRDQDIPVVPPGTADRKNVRKTEFTWGWLPEAQRRAVILDPALAPAPKPRLRPGVKSPIFRP